MKQVEQEEPPTVEPTEAERFQALGYLLFSLMALIRDPIYEYLSKGFRGQPRGIVFRFQVSVPKQGDCNSLD